MLFMHTAAGKDKAAAAKNDRKKAAKAAAAAAAVVDDDDDDAAADDEDEGSEDEGDAEAGGKKTVQVTTSLVDGWTQAALDKASLGAMMQLVKAYRWVISQQGLRGIGLQFAAAEGR
jgi:hypothetical protein